MKTSAHSALDIAKWFLYKNYLESKIYTDVEPISNLKLQKLLYYAYGCFLAMYHKRLFIEPIEAWRHGPVVPSVYQEYKEFHSNGIPVKDDIALPDFSAEETAVLEDVYNTFGQYTAWALRNMTHQETPWKKTNQGDIIPDSEIQEYFEKHYVEA